MKVKDYAVGKTGNKVVIGKITAEDGKNFTIGTFEINKSDCEQLDCVVGNLPDINTSGLKVKDSYRGIVVTRNSLSILGSITFDYYKVDPADYKTYSNLGFADIFETQKVDNQKVEKKKKP